MFRQITSIAGPHFGEIRNIKPPLSGSIIVNSIIFRKHTDKLEFVGLAAQPPLPLPLGEVPP